MSKKRIFRVFFKCFLLAWSWNFFVSKTIFCSLSVSFPSNQLPFFPFTMFLQHPHFYFMPITFFATFFPFLSSKATVKTVNLFFESAWKCKILFKSIVAADDINHYEHTQGSSTWKCYKNMFYSLNCITLQCVYACFRRPEIAIFSPGTFSKTKLFIFGIMKSRLKCALVINT